MAAMEPGPNLLSGGHGGERHDRRGYLQSGAV